MTSLKGTEFRGSELAIKWPRQLNSPSELMQALRAKTRLSLVRSPIYSKIILQVVGSWAYLVANVFNESRVFNIEVFNEELKRIEECQRNKLLESKETNSRETSIVSATPRAPLITFSNHISCIDDPVLWASLLPLTYYSTDTDSVRWSPAAVEICFSKQWHSTFFSLGRTFPIIRGLGINQPAMDFGLALLRYNQWLHLFPEGRVMRDNRQQKLSNKERGYIFKWGISKLILDYFRNSTPNDISTSEKRSIKVLPFYHLGLDEILPIGWPYIPRIGKKITILIRSSAIEMNSNLLTAILTNRKLSSQVSKSMSDDDIKRIKLTNYLEEELEKLVEPTTELHYMDNNQTRDKL